MNEPGPCNLNQALHRLLEVEKTFKRMQEVFTEEVLMMKLRVLVLVRGIRLRLRGEGRAAAGC